MVDKFNPSRVSKRGDGLYEIELPPHTSSLDAFLSTGKYKDLSIILDKPDRYAEAVVGPRQSLLLWLSELGIDPEALKSFEDAMTD